MTFGIVTSKTWGAGNQSPSRILGIDPEHSLSDGLIGAWASDVSGFRDVLGTAPLTKVNTDGSISTGVIGDLGSQASLYSGGESLDRYNLGAIASSNPLSLFGKTEMTVLAWVRLNIIGGPFAPRRIIDKSSGGDGQNGWDLVSNLPDEGNLTFQLRGDNQVVENFFVADETVLVGFSLTALDNGRFYKDGVFFGASSTILRAFSSSTTDAAIGNWNHNVTIGRMWSGDIHSVLVLDRAISDAEHWQAYDPQTRWDIYGQPARTYFIPTGVIPPVTTSRPRIQIIG